jgi:alpha-L-rhamnosidase
MLEIKRILIDYEEEQTGLGHLPKVGWQLTSDKRNVKQTAYRIRLAEDEAFERIVYDSGKTESEQSSGVIMEVDEGSLISQKKYYISVCAWAGDEESGWANSSFVTGMVHGEWSASMVSVKDSGEENASIGTYVRKAFSLKPEIAEAYVCVTAYGAYRLYINGKRVGEDEMTPGWTSFYKHISYQTYDVTDYLNSGENMVGASLGPGWYKSHMGFTDVSNQYGNRTGLLMQMIIRYKDGSDDTVFTDTTWQGAKSPVVYSEIYHGETYDQSMEIPGWNLVETKDEKERWGEVESLPYDASILDAQASGRLRLHESFPAKEIIVTPEGDYVVDFGQNLAGRLEVTAEGKAGDEIEIRCFEMLDMDGNVYLDNLREAKTTMKYIFARDGKITWSPDFTYMGFRYGKIVSFPGGVNKNTITKDKFRSIALYSDMKKTGSFECSDSRVNQLVHNIEWGQNSNFVEAPTDCPQRDERLGWTGDAQIFCRTASFLRGTYSFFSKWMKDLAADQNPDGSVPVVIPNVLSGTKAGKSEHDAFPDYISAWADAAVIVPWTVYQVYGDKRILERQYASMKGWVDFMLGHLENGLFHYDVQLGDWLGLDSEEGSYFGGTPTDLSSQAYAAYSTGLVLKTARILGKDDDEKYYADSYDKLVKRYREEYCDEQGKPKARTQTAQILSLYFDLLTKEARPKTADTLVELLKENDGHLNTGFIGTPYICHVLSQNGHAKEAYDLLLKDDFPSWLYQIKMGATTVWEHWDGMKPDGSMWSADMNSFNHYAYGAVADWLVRGICGIDTREDAPGYRHSVIAPYVGDEITSAAASYDTVYGICESKWERNGDKVTLHLTIPANTETTIRLPGAVSVEKADGLDFAKCEDGFTAETGSGIYEFIYKIK